MKKLVQSIQRHFKLLLVSMALTLTVWPALAQPTTVATMPTLPQSQVVSLYTSSGVYSDVPGVNFYEIWWGGQWTSYGDYTIPSTTSAVRGYQGLLFTGVGFESTPTNVAGCDTFHVAVYTPNGNSFAVRMVDAGGHSADVTYTIAGEVITSNTWIYLDIPMSQFAAANPLMDFYHINQLGWIINNPGETPGADYYIDNVYFSGSTNLTFSPPPSVVNYPTNNAPSPTNSDVLALYNADGTLSGKLWYNSPNIDWNANIYEWGYIGSYNYPYVITNTGNTVMYMPALSFVGANFGGQVDTTGYDTLHVDVWTYNGNRFGIQLVSLNPTEQPQVNVAVPTNGEWVGIDIPLSAFSNIDTNLDLTDIQQMQIVDNATVGGGIQGADFYVDNIYFYSNGVTAPVVINYPTNNAPTPTNAPGSVLSLYNSSGTYTDFTGIGWYASWGSASSQGDFTITNTGSIVKSYRDLNYAGVEFDPSYSGTHNVNASPYNTLHLDVWTTANQLAIKLVSSDNGAAPEYIIPASSGTITSNQWVSLDIPLSSFTSLVPTLDLANLNQMLFVDNGDIPGPGGQLGNFYIDNVYFHNVALVSPSVAASASGGNMQLSFAAQLNRNYTVQFKANLTDAVWQTLTNFTGTGSTVIISDPQNQASRFYRASVQ